MLETNILQNASFSCPDSRCGTQWLLFGTPMYCLSLYPFMDRNSEVDFHILFLKLIFYWIIVDLRYCVSFRCTAEWISYTCTSIHCFRFFFFFSHVGHYWVLTIGEFPVLYRDHSFLEQHFKSSDRVSMYGNNFRNPGIVFGPEVLIGFKCSLDEI